MLKSFDPLCHSTEIGLHCRAVQPTQDSLMTAQEVPGEKKGFTRYGST
jgi:hypothetical protein